jgi:hypothetical protein
MIINFDRNVYEKIKERVPLVFEGSASVLKRDINEPRSQRDYYMLVIDKKEEFLKTLGLPPDFLESIDKTIMIPVKAVIEYYLGSNTLKRIISEEFFIKFDKHKRKVGLSGWKQPSKKKLFSLYSQMAKMKLLKIPVKIRILEVYDYEKYLEE